MKIMKLRTCCGQLATAVVLGFCLSSVLIAPARGEGWSLTSGWKKLWNPEPKEKKLVYQVPTRVVALWAPAMYNQPGKPPTRGFGGRLYFYNAKDQPVPIEGQLVVYGFNDSVPRGDSRKPDRKFVFTSHQLAAHFSPADLGASYSIWIPWDPVGGPQLEVSLLPVFTAATGQLVMGEQSRNLLPGTTTPPANSQQQNSVVQPFIIDHRVAPASYAAPDDLGTNRTYAQGAAEQQSFFTHATQPAPRENIRTTSIQLTPGMAERLIQERLHPDSQTQPPAQTPAGNLPPLTVPPPSVLQQGSIHGNFAPQLATHPGARSFNAPTADSRAWGPTVQRMQGSTLGSQVPVGRSPTRYEPGQLPAPVTAGPRPAAAPQPIPPSPAAPAYLPAGQAQSMPGPSVPANWQTGSASAR